MSKLAGGIETLIENAFDDLMSTVHTALPGVVVSYDADKREASVMPMLKKQFQNGRTVSMPILTRVPVIFSGTQDTVIQFPLKKGDGVWIMIAERSIEEWLTSGEESISADPRRFSLSDAVCIPGLFSSASPGKVGAGEGLEIYHKQVTITIKDDGEVNVVTDKKVTVDGSEIDLNGSSKTFVTHAELNTALQTFMSALNGHTHPTAATGPPSPPTVPMTLDISSAATTTVKTGG